MFSHGLGILLFLTASKKRIINNEKSKEDVPQGSRRLHGGIDAFPGRKDVRKNADSEKSMYLFIFFIISEKIITCTLWKNNIRYLFCCPGFLEKRSCGHLGTAVLKNKKILKFQNTVGKKPIIEAANDHLTKRKGDTENEEKSKNSFYVFCVRHHMFYSGEVDFYFFLYI